MPSFYEIPLTATPQTFKVQLAGVLYQLRLTYLDVDQGGWVLDLSTESGAPLINGIPLVTGVDLLEQYAHLNLGGRLWVKGKINPDDPPTFDNIGSESLLFWVTD